MEEELVRPSSFVLLVCLVPFCPAHASDEGILKQFGMLGHLAVDCNSDHDNSNPHFVFTVSPENRITSVVLQGRNRENRPVRKLRLLTPERLQFESADLTVTWAKIDGKFRLWRMVRVDGTIYVENGTSTAITPEAHDPTPALMFCGN